MNHLAEPRTVPPEIQKLSSNEGPNAHRLMGFSALLLFFEMALIRFVPANFQPVSYFTNLVLIATFLGMGVGMILQARGKNLLPFFAPLLTLLLFTLLYFSDAVVGIVGLEEETFYLHRVVSSDNPGYWGMEQVVFLLFVITTLVFIPLGAGIAREFNKFKPLVAYSINIMGSLAGLGVFSLLSWLSIPPIVWFSAGFAYFVLLGISDKKVFVSVLCLPAALWVVMELSAVENKTGEIWSPYYRIDYVNEEHVNALKVNGGSHQWMFNFNDNAVSKDKTKLKWIQFIKQSYLMPYSFVSSLDDVLILGAGSGNDVALALEKGAGHVDAVEIDPEIIQLGKDFHFQKPYDDSRVSIYNDDARAFLKKSSKKYDLIIIGTLDSQTLLSGMSSIRLDNYVYTVESFKSMKDHLKPNGILVVYHQTQKLYVAEKIYGIFLETFGRPPIMRKQSPHLFNFTFIGGWSGDIRNYDDSLVAGISPGELVAFSRYETGGDGASIYPFKLPVDNWPYLFLRQPSIPMHYIFEGTLIFVFSILLVGGALWKKGGVGRPDWTLFFLGAGFLLLETKSVTEMSLLFGSTWVVNVLVFSSILVMVLIANGYAIRFKKSNPHYVFGLLAVCLGLIYMVPAARLLGLSVTGQWFLGSLMVAAPIFFSGILFAVIFKTREDPARSLGFNVLGAVFGGLMEYSAMASGTKSLYLVSLIMFLVAYYMFQKERAL